MEEKPFRVLLDFSEVNARISGLKYVWMHVSPRELNTINDFKQAIINKFPYFTQENFKLIVRDGLLLETEKVAVLREDDIVKIQLENPCVSLTEFNPIDKCNVSVAQDSSHSISSCAVDLNKSRKRKSETFTTLEKEENKSSSNISKKKRKDKIACLNESNNYLQEDLSGLDKNSKYDASQNKDRSNAQSMGRKRKSYPKTPTSDFIAFAVKLSEADRMGENVSQSDVNVVNNEKVNYNVSDTNLYKTADSVSKTNLSPMPERSTYVLSCSQTPNLSQSLSNSEGQVDAQIKSKKGCKKRRRKRKRKMISSNEGVSFSANASTEMEESFLVDVKSNETYNTSTDARKHIIFHSPTPPKTTLSNTLDTDLTYNPDGLKVLPIENNEFKNKSLRKDTQANVKFDKDCKSGIHEIVDFKESTPFSKTKLKQKSWGVTPLPKISSSSNTFVAENVDASKTDIKPAYQIRTPLHSLPPVGTRLAYKILELNQDYCPEITEYKEGILKKVNPNTDELEIELIQEEFKPGKSGKFENLWKDEPLPEDQVIKTVTLNWTDLIEPIHIS